MIKSTIQHYVCQIHLSEMDNDCGANTFYVLATNALFSKYRF